MKILMQKIQGGLLIPSDDSEAEKLSKIKTGAYVDVNIVQKRNVKFHRKYMALMNIGFDAFEPEIAEYKGQIVEKNFDRFRHDITILAGYYTFTTDINGDPKAVAKSISFGNMTEDEFSELYSKTIDVLLRKVLTNYTNDDIERVIEEVIRF